MMQTAPIHWSTRARDSTSLYHEMLIDEFDHVTTLNEFKKPCLVQPCCTALTMIQILHFPTP